MFDLYHFNPYHDDLGRFTGPKGARSYKKALNNLDKQRASAVAGKMQADVSYTNLRNAASRAKERNRTKRASKYEAKAAEQKKLSNARQSQIRSVEKQTRQIINDAKKNGYLVTSKDTIRDGRGYFEKNMAPMLFGGMAASIGSVSAYNAAQNKSRLSFDAKFKGRSYEQKPWAVVGRKYSVK